MNFMWKFKDLYFGHNFNMNPPIKPSLEEARDYHSCLEPVVTINDHSFGAPHPNDMKPMEFSKGMEEHSTKKRKKRYDREYSPTKDDKKVITRTPRSQIRLVTKAEALSAEETYQKRKSLPLEKCPVCKKFFRRMKTHLLKHDLKNRDPNDPLTCSVCAKAFNTPSNLQIHMRTHTGDKPYVCDVCNKAFAQSCNLINHVRTHTGEKPFKCPHCDRSFTQSGNLNNHIRLHTDEKPFKCHFCEKAFVQSGNLNSHIRNNHKFIDDNLANEMVEKLVS